MASRTPSHSSRRKTKPRTTSRRARRTPAKATAHPEPAEITPALRAEFEKLGHRWKSLLPRLTQSVGQNGGGTATRRRRAPKAHSARRRR